MHVGKKKRKICNVSFLYGNVVFCCNRAGHGNLQPALRQSSWTQSTMEWSFLCCFRPCS